jgi:hypothetical protein
LVAAGVLEAWQSLLDSKAFFYYYQWRGSLGRCRTEISEMLRRWKPGYPY